MRSSSASERAGGGGIAVLEVKRRKTDATAEVNKNILAIMGLRKIKLKQIMWENLRSGVDEASKSQDPVPTAMSVCNSSHFIL